MDDGNRLRWQLRLRIEFLDRRIVPAFYGAEKNRGQSRTVKHQVTWLYPLEVHHRNDGAHHHRELDQAIFVEVRSLERRIARAEGNSPRLDLLDAATRADRLIIEADAGLSFVGVRPFGVDRIGKGRAGAGDIDSGGGKSRHGKKASDGNRSQVLHG